MECNCGLPVRVGSYKDGRACYTCAHGRCRFFGFAPVHCEGYQRIIATSKTPAETCIVRFEALLHPITHEPAAMARVQTPNDVSGKATEEGVRLILESAEYLPCFYVAKRAYLFAMEHYTALVAKLKETRHVLVQEIPTFFFRTVSQTGQLPANYEEALASLSEAPIDKHDFVYQQLKCFQRKGVEFVVSRGGRGMIADDMGLGKTVQSIAVAHHYRAEWPVLVVCPMSLIENWAKEFNKFCAIPFSRIAILQGTKAKYEPIHEVVIVSYSSLKCVEDGMFKVVILDESHYIKAGDSKRTQLALKLCRAAQRVVLLSGTPAMSRPMELYTQLSALHASMVPTKTQYGARYCNGHLGRFGMDYQGHSHIDELHYLIQDFVIRRTKKELSEAELPSKSRQLLYVYITAKEKKALEKQVMALRKSVMDRTPSNGNGGGSAGGDIASRAPNAFELKIATAKAKIPAVQDYVCSVVEQHLESGDKIIFFAHHQCMMEAIRSAVVNVRPKEPIDYIYISGDTPAMQREQLATHFRREPSCTVAVLSMGSSGTGHNFTCASTVVFAELDWNPSTHLQCEDRVHRIGQCNPCTIKYLLADGTSDDVIWPMLQTKLTVTSAVLESGVTTTETNRLSENADKRKVSRRDVSAESASTAQGTLDNFMRSSAAASQASPRSGAVSVTPTPSDHCAHSATISATDSSHLPSTIGFGVEGNPILASPEFPRPEAPLDRLPKQNSLSITSLGALPQAASGTLPTPPFPDEETQTPRSPKGSLPTVAGTSLSKAVAPPLPSSAASAESPLVISVAELHRSPHLLNQNPTAAHRAKQHRQHNGPGETSSQSRLSSGAKGSATRSPLADNRDASGVTATNVLEMMKVKSSQNQPTDVVIVEEPERKESPLRSTLKPAGNRTTWQLGASPTPNYPGPAARSKQEEVQVMIEDRVDSLARVSSLSTSVHSAPPLPRRTMFTLRPALPEAPPLPPPRPPSSPQPPQSIPSPPATAVTVTTRTVAHIPVNFLKRPRSSAGEDLPLPQGGPTPATTASSPPPAQRSAARVEVPPPAVARTTVPVLTAGKRTTFRFSTLTAPTSGAAREGSP